MKYLSLTALTLLTTLTLSHAQETKIDMHGGKDNKIPSKMTSSKPAQKAEIFYGKVLEIKSAMAYKYLKIDEEKGTQLWIAIANAPVAVGDRVGYDKQVKMTNFKSKSLNQEFKEIYFASDVYLPQKVSAPKSMKEMLGLAPQKNAHTNMHKKTTPNAKIKVSVKPYVKKEAYSIEEIHMWRAELKDQMITIEGTATKVSHAIMKRDWIHLNDGTGSEMLLNNDLVFTAIDTSVKVGDKVMAKGKVIVDKDFGYGYFYKVIIEDAIFEVK